MKATNWGARLLFVVAFALAAVGLSEKLANVIGYTILRSLSPSQLVEYSVVVLLFAIALLLRDIRHLLMPKM